MEAVAGFFFLRTFEKTGTHVRAKFVAHIGNIGGILPRFHLCMPFTKRVTLPADGRSWREFAPVPRVKGFLLLLNLLSNCTCMSVVTYNGLSAHRVYRLRDISNEIDARIFGLTGT